ncbi:hypothetical protein LCGC14_0842590 [marine sediment metagenome]|uniref:Uncharacterized protein n=1 Tax=marine sediment metagenome TaxID=412755 RepID=A0A0F9RXB7_9ZZZZ
MDRNLKLGHYFKGAEPTGCYNTGIAPVIARSKQALKYTGKAYIVGRDLDVLYNMTDLILTVMRGKPIKAKLYSSKAQAFTEFERLNQIIIDSNTQDIKRIKELRRKARSGDMAAALALTDY